MHFFRHVYDSACYQVFFFFERKKLILFNFFLKKRKCPTRYSWQIPLHGWFAVPPNVRGAQPASDPDPLLPYLSEKYRRDNVRFAHGDYQPRVDDIELLRRLLYVVAGDQWSRVWKSLVVGYHCQSKHGPTVTDVDLGEVGKRGTRWGRKSEYCFTKKKN